MATYTARTRSNYFKVKDLDAFRRFIGEFDEYGLKVDQQPNETVPNRVAVFATSTGGSLPHFREDAEGQLVEIDFLAELSAHLCEGEVAIFMEAGHEAWRYMYGAAFAINSDAERVSIDLQEIYPLVEERLATEGVEITRCQY